MDKELFIELLNDTKLTHKQRAEQLNLPISTYYKQLELLNDKDKQEAEAYSESLPKLYSNPREYALKIKYGITLDEFNQLLLSQNNSCAICSRHLDSTGRETHLDHNHTTNKIRGILCTRCNLLLGCALDNITILSNAIKYLEQND